MTVKAIPNIVVLGGGFGGLESAFYLRMKLHDQARITLISDRDYFLFKPNTIYIPFGLDPDRLKINLARPTRRKGIDFIQAKVEEIDTTARTVNAAGRQVPYDYLMVATGAGMRPAEVPGLTDYAQTIWTPLDMLRLRTAYYQLIEEAKAGRRKELLFLVPPNNKCSGPLYEMVFMIDTYLRRKGVRKNVNITWSTYESGYIQAFGPRLDISVSGEFKERGVTGHTEYAVSRVEPNEVLYKNGERLPYDLLVSFPPYIAATQFPGMPADDRGFIATEPATRQVAGHPEIYAVGDTGDFPVKQAFLAFLQADAAADHLASTILGHAHELPFEPTSMCVMEEFDRATFAQVPLRLTGRPEKPVEVRPDADGMYRVGSGPVWRAGKWMIATYLPFRFKNGNPFHAGLPWKGMDAGLKVMSHLLAK